MSTRVALALFALTPLSACAHSAEPRLYVLASQQGTVASDARAVVQIDRPHIAGYLDRRELVQRTVAQQLELTTRAAWAEPLDAMIGRVLAQDLAQRAPSTRVYGEAGGLSARPDLRVSLDVQQFDQEPNGDVALLALVQIRRADDARAIVLEQVSLRSTPRGRDTPSVVAALSGLLGQLADRLAPMIATTSLRNEAAAPPTTLPPPP